MDQLEKYQSDYFDYLQAPESAIRYQTALQQILQHMPRRPIRLVDLGCGNGALAQYIGDDFLYLGLDHNPAAIDSARAKSWPEQNPPQFMVANILEWANLRENDVEPKADVLVLSGLLSGVLLSTENTQILIPDGEQSLLLQCMRYRLDDKGLVSIVTPFSYDLTRPSSLFGFASARRLAIDQRLPLDHLNPLVETIVPMPKVGDAIARQQHKPNWYQNYRPGLNQAQKGMGVCCSLFARR